MKLSKKERTRIMILSVVTISLICVLFTSVKDNIDQIYINNIKINELTNNYENLITEESSLKSEVTKLKDDDYIIRYGKEKFFYSDKNDIIIRFE